MPDTVMIRRYTQDDDPEEVSDRIVTEAQEHEVDLIVSPYTQDAVTYSMTVEEAWRLLRMLARSIATIENAAEDA